MGGKKWTEEELSYLTKQYGKQPVEHIAEALGRTVSAVQSKGPQLGLNGRTDAWTKHEEKFLKENYLLLGSERCAQELGRTIASVHSKIRQVGGGRESIGPKVQWTDEELEFLREKYQTMDIEELEEKLGRTKGAIYARARMLDIQRYVDPYPFFAEWTEESAYVIGFFAADGWATKRGPESIRIGFGQKDADVLYSIRDVVGVGDVYSGNREMHRYYVQSTKAYERLCEVFGHDVCTKCHKLQWPGVPTEYVRHFLRGAVDGDGSLFRRKQDGLWDFAYTTSSQAFIDGMVQAVEEMTGVHLNVGLNKINVWHARCCGIKAVCLADWLYRDAKIALERKAWIAREMMRESGIAQRSSLTPKMYEMFPHILARYQIV